MGPAAAVGAVGGSAAGSSAGGSAAGARGGSSAGASGSGPAGASGAGTAGAAGSGETRLDPTPGSYRLTCDGSMAVMIDATHFLDGNDEQQEMRLYTRGATGTPLATIDISTGIGLATSDEADFEDAARIGDRIYVIGSHGRNKSGKLERARYRFFAMDLAGAAPAIALSVPGYTGMLLDQMLMAENWVTPDAAVLTTLTASSNLTRATDPALPPLAGGTNIEGLAWLPDATRPNQLLIGFRSPLQGGKAIVVSLLNADAVIAGVTARFGAATLLDLGGLSIRSMTWSPVHEAILLIAGPSDRRGRSVQAVQMVGRRERRADRASATSRARRPPRRPKRSSPTRIRATCRSSSTRATTTSAAASARTPPKRIRCSAT